MNALETIQQYAKMLRNLDRWLDKAVAYADAKKFDPNVLVQARLAPDQFPLARQVQASCDQAKYALAYLSGTTAPSHPDTETTIAELKQRIQTCLSYLETASSLDLTNSDQRRISPPWMKTGWVSGKDYLAQLSIPNFYFHITTAYAIMRHNGVDLGKTDYLGSLPIQS